MMMQGGVNGTTTDPVHDGMDTGQDGVDTSSASSLTSQPLYQLALSLWTYYYPVLLLLGTFGNVMSVVIMVRLMTSESTVNLFFIALAVGDLLLLYTGAVMKWVEIINAVNRWPQVYFPVLCLYLASGGYVSWMLASLTLQRAFSVAWPHLVARVFTRHRVVTLLGAVALFQLALYSHHSYCVYVTATTNLTSLQCIRLPTFHYAKFLAVFIYVAMSVTSVLPFTCLVVGNAVLAAALIKSLREKSIIHSGKSSDLEFKRRRDANSVTVTIIVVSLTFIVLTLPVFVHSSLFRFKDQSGTSGERKAEVFLMYTVTSLMYFTNSAINFVLYCLTGRRFREEFVKIMTCRARRT